MKTPAPSRFLRDLRDLTPARVGLGRAGVSMPTKELLGFTLDHARARDAVHAAFDPSAICSALDALGLRTCEVSSRARDRKEYLRRPDLGRMLDQSSQQILVSQPRGSCRLAIVIGDGLSPAAVNSHAIELIRKLMPGLSADGIDIGQTVVATRRACRPGRRDRRHSRCSHDCHVDRRAAGPVRARQPGRLPDLRAEAGLDRRKTQLRLQHPRFGAWLRGGRLPDRAG